MDGPLAVNKDMKLMQHQTQIIPMELTTTVSAPITKFSFSPWSENN